MLSYFIVAHCTFMKNFSSKLKSRFQVNFSQDPFPLTMVSWVHFWPAFYCRTLRTVSLLMDEGMLALTITLFTKIHLYILLSAWFVARYFSFVEQTVLPSFFISLQMVIRPAWSHLWYFWISFFCILMQIAPVHRYIQWNSL